MKTSEIKQLTTEELARRLDDEQTNLVDLRFTHALKQLTNTAKLGDAKRTIARLKTEILLRNSKEVKSNG